MPPKQDPASQIPYKPCFVLPVVMDPSQQQINQALKRSVNIKKDINGEKIIQILKDKGLEPYLEQGKIKNKQGRQFVCKNIKTVADEMIAALSKPADPKKDAKKDNKKDTKKQQPVVQVTPPIELDYQKKCNDFFLILDFPKSTQQLYAILQSGIKIDIVVAIQPQIKPGSKKPDYTLLKNDRSVEDLGKTLNDTSKQQKQIGSDQQKQVFQIKQMIEKYLYLKAQKLSSYNEQQKQFASNYVNSLYIQISYMKDLSHPETNEQVFINKFYQQLCKCTVHEQQYKKWKQERTIKNMIQPLKEIIKKQVQVENQDKGKKGGKAQPVFQTVEQVVQTKYQSLPENIKCDMKDYKEIKNILQHAKISRAENISNKNDEDIFGLVLDSCVLSVQKALKLTQQVQGSQKQQNKQEIKEQQSQNQQKQNKVVQNSKDPIRQKNINRLASKINQKFQSLPLNKINTSNTKYRIRQISYTKDVTMNGNMKFEFPDIQSDISFMQIAQILEKGSVQSLKVQFLVHKMEELAKKCSPKIKWDFGDRKYVQKFSADRIKAIINRQLLNDPQIFTGYLESEGVRLLVTTRTNPPGRVLYHNSIMPWKIVPDYQNWVENFITNKECLETNQFFDYSCFDAGNLSICTKNMMPTDNTVIRDTQYTIGLKKKCMIQICKNQCRFGLTKVPLLQGSQVNQSFIYWHQLDDNLLLRFNRTKRIHKIKKQQKQIIKQQKEKPQENNQTQKQQIKQDKEDDQYEQKFIESTDFYIQCKNKKYIIKNDPYPTIFWKNFSTNKSQGPQLQQSRSFGPTGQITSFRSDGSVHVYFPNGNILIHRNGKWTKIINNVEHILGEKPRQLSINQIIQGQTTIRIREDQLIMITLPNGHKKIIFPDSTEIYQHRVRKYDSQFPIKRQIKNPKGPIMRITLPKQNYSNVIGYGSAFAYLGFQNILQRSGDGYMFQIFDNQISSHYYVQTYELDGKIFYEQMRLVTYQDSSMLKIQATTGKIVYVSPNPKQLLTQEYQNQRWLQMFTTTANHGEGVFDIDLIRGTVQNRDGQSNHFIAAINEASQAKIAVSFIKETEQSTQRKKLGQGFHVKGQNYFLPPPNNRIPARLFTIHADGSGVQYLNQQQIVGMSNYSVNEQFVKDKIVKQYCLEIKPQNNQYMQLSFTKNIDINQFGLPEALKAPQTKKSLVPYTFHEVKHRVLQFVPWNSDYSLVTQLSNKVKQQQFNKTQKLSTLKA